jgi:anti-sigma factor RsiW
MNEASFEGLLTDYALGEMSDPDTKALLEALLERDESLRASLAEIRSMTELIVLAGPESLVSHPESKPRSFFARHAPKIVSAGLAAALVLMSLILWWPTPSHTQSDPDLATRSSGGFSSSVEKPRPAAVVTAGGQPFRLAANAVENRTPRPSRRGVGVRWSAFVCSQGVDRQ